MEGDTLTKIARLARYSFLQPAYLPQYLRTLPCWGLEPLDLKLPWISSAAISFLQNYLQPTHRVFEWGGGGSTLFFSERCEHVTTIESHQSWFEKIQQCIDLHSIKNVSLQCCDTDISSEEGFRSSVYYQALGQERYDVILIDGYEESVQLRPLCFEYAESHIVPGGIIIVDDSWRYPQIRQNHSAHALRCFSSIGPYRYGVTSTDIYFY